MFINNYIISPTRRGGGEALQTVTAETTSIEGTAIPPVDGPPTVTPSVAPVTEPPLTPVDPSRFTPVDPSRFTPVDPNVLRNPSRIPAPKPVAATGPVDRAKFAALFPEDRELLGIGSLIGAA